MKSYNRTRLNVLYGVIFLAAVAGQVARADLLPGGANNFGIIAGTSVPTLNINNGVVDGNIGIANPTGHLAVTGPETINGNILFAGPVNASTSDTTINGSITGNNSSVTMAMTAMSSLSTLLAAEAGTDVAINVGNGQIQTINASSGSLDGSGNRVFTVTSFNLNDTSTGGLVINGSASDYVVLNISSGISIQGNISLSGGITSDHVLFNIAGSGNTLQSSGGPTIYGIVLDPNGQLNLDNITIYGRAFGGDTQNIQAVSGFNLYEPVPEPTSLSLLGAAALGLAAVFYSRRRGSKAR